ncbi:MAG: hypothetical protein ACQEXX_24550 [Bacillota bacterium]
MYQEIRACIIRNPDFWKASFMFLDIGVNGLYGSQRIAPVVTTAFLYEMVA